MRAAILRFLNVKKKNNICMVSNELISVDIIIIMPTVQSSTHKKTYGKIWGERLYPQQ